MVAVCNWLNAPRGSRGDSRSSSAEARPSAGPSAPSSGQASVRGRREVSGAAGAAGAAPPPEPGRAEAFAARLFTNLLLSPLYRRYVDEMGLRGDERVLDYGSGSGAAARHLARRVSGGRRAPRLHGRLGALAGGDPQGPARLPRRRVPARRRAHHGPAGRELRRRAGPLDAARRPAVGPAVRRCGARAAAAPRGAPLLARADGGQARDAGGSRRARCTRPPASSSRSPWRARRRSWASTTRAVWTKPAR